MTACGGGGDKTDFEHLRDVSWDGTELTIKLGENQSTGCTWTTKPEDDSVIDYSTNRVFHLSATKGEAVGTLEAGFKGSVCSCIMYDEGRAHRIYAGADALLVPSLFEPCGLTQLIAMRYGTVPVVRETGGLKDTVEPYNEFTNEGNGFTFDRYEAGLLYDAVNRAKTLYFTDRWHWDEMVQRDMAKDVSWEVSAEQYRELYLELKPY